MSTDALRLALEDARLEEKRQALFYRALAAEAELGDHAELAERFHALHADEQHHLSRLTARLVELGAIPADLAGVRPERASLADWATAAREHERRERERYATLLRRDDLDPDTRALLEEIQAVEAKHAEERGGKWTMA